MKRIGGISKLQGCCLCCFLCVGLILTVVIVTTSLIPRSTTPSVDGHNATLKNCNWLLNLTTTNVSIPMSCGGPCRKACGTCDVVEPTCSDGSKWCPVKCPTGTACLYERDGTTTSDCEGLCFPDNMCHDQPTVFKRDKRELEYSIVMVCVYGFVALSNIFVFCCQRFNSIGRVAIGYLTLIRVFAVVAVIILLVSVSFLVWAIFNPNSLHFYRLVTFCSLGAVSLVILCVTAKRQSYELGKAPYLMVAMWVLLFTSETMSDAISYSQRLLKTLGELHPFVADNEKCTHDEYLHYVIVSLIFGVSSYILANMSTYFRFKDNRILEDFFYFLTIPTLIMWTVAIVFFGLCRVFGYTTIVVYAVTVSVFYFIFIGANMYVLYVQTIGRSMNWEMDLSDIERDSMMYDPERSENPTDSEQQKTRVPRNTWAERSVPVGNSGTMEVERSSGEDSIPDSITSAHSFPPRRMYYVEQVLFRFCRPQVFTMYILAFEYIAILWFMYDQYQRIKKDQGSSMFSWT